MLLCLLRHGIAEDPGPATGHRDAPRRLTGEGVSRMEAEARGMKTLGIAPDVVVHSPLVRCAQTARIVAEHLGAPLREHASISPGADTSSVLDRVAEHPDAGVVMVCGHEPDMSRITADLTGGYVEFKKGTLAVIEIPDGRAGGGFLRALLTPRALRAAGGDA